jgi:hypothetical protein
LELEKAAEHGAQHGVKIKKMWQSADGYNWSGAGHGKPAAKPKPRSFNTSTASITRAEGIQHWEAKAPWPSNARQPKRAIGAA